MYVFLEFDICDFNPRRTFMMLKTTKNSVQKNLLRCIFMSKEVMNASLVFLRKVPYHVQFDDFGNINGYA